MLFQQHRECYGVKIDAVFCNLTSGNRGRPMVKEAYRKMMSSMVDSKSLARCMLLCDLFKYHSTPESGIERRGIRTHSCRRTAAYYAAWLGIPEATIKVSSVINSE